MAKSQDSSFLPPPLRILTHIGFVLFAILFVAFFALFLSFGGVAIADEWDSLNTFFSDNYQVKANKSGAAINDASNNQLGRFGDGLLQSLDYSVNNTNAWQTQVGNPNGEFLMAARSDCVWSHASLDYNFNMNMGTSTAAEEGGRFYEIGFKIRPVENYTGNLTSDWGGIIFGLDETSRFTDINKINSQQGYGILFRKNGGIQTFDGTTVKTLSSTYSLVNNWADVKIQYFVSDFDKNSPVDIRIYVNGDLVETLKTKNGFSNNYIQFTSIGTGSGAGRSMFTNFTLKSSANYNYDVSNPDVFVLDKDWTTNGLDKRDVVFQSARDGATEAEHTGSITMGADTTIDVASGLSLYQSGDITGQYTLTKTGEGTLLINAAQGAVDVESLVVSSGRLDMKEYFKGDLEINNSATFSPGNSIGPLYETGNFTLDAGATLLMEIGGTDAADNDQLIVSGTTTYQDNSIIQFVLDSDSNYIPALGDVIEVTMPKIDDWSKVSFSSYFFTIKGYEGGNVILGVNPNAVPEPSTWALLLLGAAGLLYVRKRKN